MGNHASKGPLINCKPSMVGFTHPAYTFEKPGPFFIPSTGSRSSECFVRNAGCGFVRRGGQNPTHQINQNNRRH